MKVIRLTDHKKDNSDLQDPERRNVIIRVGGALVVAGVAGFGAYALYNDKHTIRSRKELNKTISDHRVHIPPTSPRMVIVRGPNPETNVRAALERMGGIQQFVAKGDVVLIKPNVGWDRTPEQAADTNPDVVAALVKACRTAGAKQIIVTDCPVNNAEQSFTRSGILDAAQKAGGKVILPNQSQYVTVHIPGKLGQWQVLEPFVIADKIINVPIAKHHSLTRVTVGMKNWYGILGGQRSRLHQRADDSVAELAALMKPTLTVIDATRILLRNGPTGGNLADVKQEDTIAVSIDPIAADAWAATLLGAEPEKLGWLQKSYEKKLGQIDFRSLNPIEITTT